MMDRSIAANLKQEMSAVRKAVNFEITKDRREKLLSVFGSLDQIEEALKVSVGLHVPSQNIKWKIVSELEAQEQQTLQLSLQVLLLVSWHQMYFSVPKSVIMTDFNS